MPPYDNTLQEIKDRLDIVDLISEYVHLKKAGQNWKGLCPFHTEKTPSFTVSPAKQIFHCFGCGTGGDIFTFLVRYENLTFPEALSMLARKAGVTIKKTGSSAASAGERETLLNIHRDAAHFFRENLKKDAKAQSYLNARNISRDVQEMFSLGYAPKSWNSLIHFLTSGKYKHEHIKKAGLAVQGQKGMYDTFRERIIFPIYDLKGDIVAFGGRAIGSAEPKYLNSPETLIFNKRKILYGLDRAKEAVKHDGHALFMEGYIDVITAHVYGFTNAVAPLGTAFTTEHGKLIKRFTEDIVLVFDSDPAGVKAVKNAAHILFESGLNVKVLSFPDNEDPDSFLKKHGKDAFGRLLEHPLSIIDFIIKYGKDKRFIVREALETVSRIPDRVLAGEYVKTLAEQLNVDERDIREEYQRIRKQPAGGYRKPAEKERPKPARKPLDEIYMIKLLLQVPAMISEVSGILTAGDFRDPALGSIYQKILDGENDFNRLLAGCEGEARDTLTEISFIEDFQDPEKALNDCIRKIRDNRRRALIQELHGRIRDAEKKKDFELLKKLQNEQQKLLRS